MSQVQFNFNSNGKRCLVYTEDTGTKSNDGGLGHMKINRKVVWVCPSKDQERCPVRLVEKYLKLCPNYTRKPNFYLQSLQKSTPTQWYAEQVIGFGTLSKTIKTMLYDARINRIFTGHSLRRSAISRMFRAGMQKKIIREMSGHRSDALEQYEITSDKQKEQASAILQKPPVKETCREVTETLSIAPKEQESVKENSVSNVSVRAGDATCTTRVQSNEVGNLVSTIINENKGKGRMVIKMEIEIFHDRIIQC